MAEPRAGAGALRRVAWRSLARHPWQSGLMILGIALGVAVAVAVDLANASAARAFETSTDAVAGRATHQVVAGPQGLDDQVYVRLRMDAAVDPPAAAAPVVTEIVSSPQLGGRPLQLMGVDPFAEAPFRSYLWRAGEAPVDELSALLTRPGAVLLAAGTAAEYGLQAGQSITLEVGGYTHSAWIAGLLRPSDALSRRALDGIVLADIATAQELTGRLGRLDRIDLILPEGDPAAVARVRVLLPPGAEVVTAAARAGAVVQMTAAFRLNLLALSLLALVVGFFLIYNTMTFSVVQRRGLFGTLRCLGVTRREIFRLVAGEALIVGVIGSALGLVLGVAMGRSAVRMVSQTIGDLYFTLTVTDVVLPAGSLIKGALLGIAATVLAAAFPAWEAASVPASVALSRSGLEGKARRSVGPLALAGLALAALGAGLLALPGKSLLPAFAGTFAVVAGFAALTPAVTVALMRGAARLLGRVLGALGRMAPRNVAGSISRTAVAIASLMVAVSVTIGVSLMIASFRATVVDWLEQVLVGDVYVSAPGPSATMATTPLDPALLGIAQQWPGVTRVDLLRTATVESPGGPVIVFAIENPAFGRRPFLATDAPRDRMWAALQEGAVAASEPYANRAGLPRHGGSVTLITDGGPRQFRVAGIYYDYVASQGTLTMSIDTYRRYWHDDTLTALSLHVAPGAGVDAVVRGLSAELTPYQQVFVQPNQELRQDGMAVFDRTFAITGALQLLATVVAFIGVLSALLSLELEKQREMGILRAVGLTARQLWAVIALETGLMGGVAGLLAMPTGAALSWILIYIINRRSFGWTLHMQLGSAPFLEALAVAVVAALLAGVYPAYRLGRAITAEALRYE